MPARDVFHETVKIALQKDGWQIKADPLHLKLGKRDFYVDLTAEKFLIAEKGGSKIAIEVKSFIGDSEMRMLEQCLGQFLIYRSILARQEPARTLHLAISELAFHEIFEDDIGRLVLEDYGIPLLIFDERTEEVLAWRS